MLTCACSQQLKNYQSPFTAIAARYQQAATTFPREESSFQVRHIIPKAAHLDRVNPQTLWFHVPADRSWTAGLEDGQESQAARVVDTVRRRDLAGFANDHGEVHLQHKFMRNTAPQFLDIRNRLESSGVLNVDHSYSAGSHSMGYSLLPPYSVSRLAAYHDPALWRRIQRANAKLPHPLQNVHLWLREWLRQLSFDMTEALRRIDLITEVPERRRKQPMSLAKYLNKLRELCKSFDSELTLGRIGMTLSRHGRISTAYARLPKLVRACVTFEGETLVSSDLKNCQPLLLAMVVQEFESSRQAKDRLINHQPSTSGNPYRRFRAVPRGEGGGGEERVSPMMQKSQQTYENRYVSADLLADIPISHTYLHICEQGQLYEMLTAEGEDRQETKQRILVDVLCADASYPSPVRDRFTSMFPRETSVLRALRSKGVCRSAWILQNVESTIFIRRICGRVMAEQPDVPVFTTHDCLSTIPRHIEYVESVAVDEFRRLDLYPTFDREIYK